MIRMGYHKILVVLALFVVGFGAGFLLIKGNAEPIEPRRVGVIGATTSHVPAFVQLFNDPRAGEPFDRYKIVAAYAGGMPDNPDSWDRMPGYVQGLQEAKITLYPTIEAMLEHVDYVLLTSVDGRPHLEQAKPVIAAGKPLFIDKPMAGSLADVLEIFRLAEENNVPVFSASSLRYSEGFQKMRNEKPLGEIYGCEAFSPCSYNDKHPDFFWYGVHGVETLFTIMGTGCQTVARTHAESADLAVGVWKDGRIGVFRGTRQGPHDYGAYVWAEKGAASAGKYDGYKGLAVDICHFFDKGKPSFDRQETIEMFAFMEAADISRERGGCPVSLEEALNRTKSEVPVRVEIVIPTNFGEMSEKTVRFNGETLPVTNIRDKVNELKASDPQVVVKVILRSEKGVSIENVRLVTDQLNDAYLANYLYEADFL